MLMAVLEVHKDDMQVRYEALQVGLSHTSTYLPFNSKPIHLQYILPLLMLT